MIWVWIYDRTWYNWCTLSLPMPQTSSWPLPGLKSTCQSLSPIWPQATAIGSTNDTRCMSASPAPGQPIQSFLQNWGQIRLFGKCVKTFQRLCRAIPNSACRMKTAPDEVAPDRFCFPKANMVLPARASKVLVLISQGRAKASGCFHGCSKTSTFSQEAFGDKPCKAPSDLGWKPQAA